MRKHSGNHAPVPVPRLDIATSWGAILVETTGGKVAGCHLPALPGRPELPFSILSAGRDPASRHVVASLTGGKSRVPELVLPEGTAFQQQVWRAIAAIPRGETRTYAELASAVGRPRAYRAVANACGRNPLPLFIPCHRVVGSGGNLGGFSSGVAWKRLLLGLEAARA